MGGSTSKQQQQALTLSERLERGAKHIESMRVQIEADPSLFSLELCGRALYKHILDEIDIGEIMLDKPCYIGCLKEIAPVRELTKSTFSPIVERLNAEEPSLLWTLVAVPSVYGDLIVLRVTRKVAPTSTFDDPAAE